MTADNHSDGGAAAIPDGEQTPAPVSEADEWRSRALSAEARAAELAEELAAARSAQEAAELGARIERELRGAEALDLETARMLTEAALAGADEPDVAGAVAELKRRKPFLFASERPAGAMSGHVRPTDERQRLAEDARATGDRGALLRYLRARRACA